MQLGAIVSIWDTFEGGINIFVVNPRCLISGIELKFIGFAAPLQSPVGAAECDQ
jgi:hypothetical protein